MAGIGHKVALAAMAVAMLGTAGCGSKTPKGQVVASVNGEDVTRRDLAAELQASNAPKNVDLKAVQPMLVDRLVSRKLMVEEAQKQGIDKSPEFLAVDQRAREVLLAQLLAQRWASKVQAPSSSDVAAFISQNPQAFAQRKLIAVDQIKTDLAGIDLKALQPMTTNDQVAGYLTSKNHPFQRGRGVLDTLALPPSAVKQILSLPPGMPFVVNEGGAMLSNAVLETRDAPLPEADRQQVATKLLTQRDSAQAVQNQIDSLKRAGKVEYQPGFAPPAKKDAAPATN